jgi:type I restriction enzyme M protein
MALKKSQLYSSLWRSCDELRGGMDASQYKDYVLTLLFMKYVSDKYADTPHATIEVPEGGGFADMVRLKGDKEIGDKINKIIGRLAEANDLTGVITEADFNDEDRLGRGQEMIDRLSKLVAIFDGLDFRANRAEGDDLLGDAYEYLMRHFATESGKSKGQFYTPAEVSRIMAKVVGIGAAISQAQTLYDPTCGSGSLLLKAADEAPSGISIYGQEMDNATYALARMNMILHGHPTAELWRGNTLATPYFTNERGGLKTFDFAVANPPFSAKSWTNGFNPGQDEFHRFDAGIPPAKNGDYAFLLHVVASLKSTGKGAIILPHGVLFRGNAEATIRRNLIRRGVIKGIIGLPANLFYGTGIPACIVVLDKEHAAARTGIFMIDASKGFAKDGPKNRLRSQDIHKIVDVFNRQLEVPRYARLASLAEIESNDFNLNIPRYIDASEPEDLHDLEAHLRGGIPERDIDALGAYWEVMPSLRGELFEAGDRPGYLRARVATTEVKAAVLAHPEFRTFERRVGAIFEQWRGAHETRLMELGQGVLPKAVIEALSEDLLVRFGGLPLLDQYDVYQRLMAYWAEVMQDDVYLLAAEGWVEAARPRGIIEDRERKISETPDVIVGKKKYKMDLLPPALIAGHFFAGEQAEVEALEGQRDAATAELEAFVEEHGGEEGLLEGAKNEKDAVTQASVKKQLKTIFGEPESDDEREALTRASALIDAEAGATRAAKEAQARLDAAVLARYGKLTEKEIKQLVVCDKWFVAVQDAIEGEVQRLSQGLVSRVKVLAERYDETMPELEEDVSELSRKVEGHLRTMGLVRV